MSNYKLSISERPRVILYLTQDNKAIAAQVKADAATATAAATAASTSASDANAAQAQSEQAATQAEQDATAAALSASSAATSESNAENAATAAETSATSADNSATAASISENNAEASAIAADQSAVETASQLGKFIAGQLVKDIWVWDSIIRPDTPENSGQLGNTDNGLSYLDLGTSNNWRILNNSITLTGSTNKIAVIDRNGLGTGSVGIDAIISNWSGSTGEISLLVGKDASNYIRIRTNMYNFEIITCLSGVETIRANLTFPGGVATGRSYNNKKIDLRVALFIGGLSDDSKVILKSELFPEVLLSWQNATDIRAIFPNNSDVRYIGFARITGTTAGTQIHSWKSYNLER